jgi:hypothetical protein
MSDFQFPNFNTPGFPYQNFLEQLAASLQQPSSGSYKRFGATGSGAGSPNSPGTPSGPSNPPVTIPNFPAFGPGQSPFQSGLPNVAPAGANGGLLNSPPPTTPSVATKAPGQQKAGTGLFGNGMGIDANNLPAMLGGGQASTPQAQAFVNAYNQMNPALSYSPQAVQNAQNAGRNDLAYLMLAQGGQGLRDAAGATPDSINNAFYNQGGATARFDPATIAALLGFGARRG